MNSTSEILRMKFVFDTDKLKANKMTENQCLDIIRNYTSKHNITEIEKGTFDSSDLDNTDPFFYMIMKLPDTKWFMKVIKTWTWYIENDEEDCIKAYYNAVSKNS